MLAIARPATEPRNPETPKVHYKVQERDLGVQPPGKKAFRGSVAGRGHCKHIHQDF